MTDLEMVRLCAESMAVTGLTELDGKLVWFRPRSETHARMRAYDPLHDDAQAMALVKKFGLGIGLNEKKEWVVVGESEVGLNTDLNRSIVECVAETQEAKARVA